MVMGVLPGLMELVVYNQYDTFPLYNNRFGSTEE
jgi:hypothetical protein